MSIHRLSRNSIPSMAIANLLTASGIIFNLLVRKLTGELQTLQLHVRTEV